MEITIKSAQTRTETTTKGTVLLKQQAAMESGRDYPLVFELTVKQPYAPGKYTLGAASFRAGRFGGLELDSYGLQLVPLKG
ncbi:MAG: single-stranded DNA-binding protein [Lysobacterales bacterium]